MRFDDGLNVKEREKSSMIPRVLAWAFEWVVLHFTEIGKLGVGQR